MALHGSSREHGRGDDRGVMSCRRSSIYRRSRIVLYTLLDENNSVRYRSLQNILLLDTVLVRGLIFYTAVYDIILIHFRVSLYVLDFPIVQYEYYTRTHTVHQIKYSLIYTLPYSTVAGGAIEGAFQNVWTYRIGT